MQMQKCRCKNETTSVLCLDTMTITSHTGVYVVKLRHHSLFCIRGHIMSVETLSPETSGRNEPANASNAREHNRSVRLQVNDSEMSVCYANAFRMNSSADEVFVDLGINTTTPTPGRSGNEAASRQVRFDVSHRVVLNYYTAKRLVMVLGGLVRQHEQRFGELKLDVAERLAGDHSATTE